MHKLVEYICDELEDLERKAEKDGKLSMSEVEYMDTLAHAKKNLLKGEEMSDEVYSNNMMYDNGSYARGDRMGRSYARRRGSMRGANQYGSYAMGGYSRAAEDTVMELHDLMNDVDDDRVRKEIRETIKKIEKM